MNKLLISAAIIGVTAISAPEYASAYGTGTFKCFGVAKAGKNDCGAADGSHTCAGKATKNNYRFDWIYVENEQECGKVCGSFKQPDLPPNPAYCSNVAAPAPSKDRSGVADLNTMPVVGSAPSSVNKLGAGGVIIRNQPGAVKVPGAFVSDRD